MITTSAPGKIMLLGEHAVVYGQPCIVTAVNERLHVSIEPSDRVQFETPHSQDTRFLEAAVSIARQRLGLDHVNVKLTTHNGFASVKGFGSSSAVTVATIKAIADFFHMPLTPKELFEAAFDAVLSVQGVGSGFDVAAATYGGTLQFKKGGALLDPLMLPTSLPLVIGYTGIKADTAAIIKEIAQKKEENSEKVTRIFEAIGKLVTQAKPKMTEGDWERVGKLMDFNQEYLRDLGVSSEKLEALIAAAKTAGAYGAKLSGAGRGDCMIALVSPGKRFAVEEAIQKVGGEVVPVSVHAPGVMIDTTDDQSELFVVVDRDDRIIDYKTRYECHHDASLIHRAVNALIFDDKGRVLLQKRSDTKDKFPGFWTTSVGGHVSKGESYDQAMQREMQEELGVHLPLVLHSKFIFTKEQESEMEALYTAHGNGPFQPDKTELAEIIFVSKEELVGNLLSQKIKLTPLADYALHTIGFLS